MRKVIIGLLLILLCVGCSKQENMDKEPEIKPQIETPLSKKEVEEQLRNKLAEKVEGEILEFDFSDYDHNETYEAFALVDKTVYYISEDSLLTVNVNDRYFPNTNDSLLKTDDQDFFVIEGYCETSVVNYIFTVYQGHVQDLTKEGSVESFCYLGDHTFSVAVSDYDALSDGTGHTWKRYQLYYDGLQGLKEYQGIYVTMNDLSKYAGYEQIEEAVRNDKGGILDSIIYRENGLLQVNYHVDEQDYAKNYYHVYSLKDHTIKDTEIINWGVYQLSATHFAGTAPEKLPD